MKIEFDAVEKYKRIFKHFLLKIVTVIFNNCYPKIAMFGLFKKNENECFKVYKQFLRFIIIGMVNTLFGYGVYSILLFLKIHYSFAVIIATIIGLCFNFFTIGKYVFKISRLKLIAKFSLVYAVIILLNIIGIKLLVETGLNPFSSGACLIFPLAILTFILNKMVVFEKTDHIRKRTVEQI